MMNSPIELKSLSLRLVPASEIEKAEAVLPRTASMHGDMTAKGKIALRLDGIYKGKITLEEGSCIHITADAVVDTEMVVADHIVVEGTVKGSLQARESIELLSTARIKGSVTYGGKMDVHAGARISGQIVGPEQD